MVGCRAVESRVTLQPDRESKGCGRVPDDYISEGAAESDMKELVERIKTVEQTLSKEKGPLSLFALFLREDAPDKWDLLVAAPWAEKNRASSLKTVSDLLQKMLTKDDLVKLSRVVIVDQKSSALAAVRRAITIEHGDAEIMNSNFFGFQIRHAYVITSQDTGATRINRPTRVNSESKGHLEVRGHVSESEVVDGATIHEGGSLTLAGISKGDVIVKIGGVLHLTGIVSGAVKNEGGTVRIDGIADSVQTSGGNVTIQGIVVKAVTGDGKVTYKKGSVIGGKRTLADNS